MKTRAALFLLVLVMGLVAAAIGARTLWQEHEHHEAVRRTADVVTAVRDLARLEAAEYHLERVIDLHDQQSRLYGLVEGEDAVLLVAAGDVVAGVDLAKVKAADVTPGKTPGTLLVRLPAPEIFHARLDEAHTYVHSRQTDMFAERNEALEGRARQLAVARNSGILDRARVQTERLLRSMLRQFGAREVTIVWGPALPS
jgi:hypothetical protein